MYKAIFSDLDSTLLNDDKKISQKNLEAIDYLKSRGIKFLLNTGRLPFCFDEFKELDISNAISCDGSIVFSDGKLIYDSAIDSKTAKAIVEYGIKHEEYCRIFCFDYLYILHPEKSEGNSTQYAASKVVDYEEALKIVEERSVYKVGFRSSNEHLKKVKKDLDDLNLGVNVVFSDINFIEAVAPGSSKGMGIIKFCEYNNIDLKDTIGVGDNDNDMPMLKTVGLSCCPSNAIKEVKQICDFVSTFNNNDGVIYDIVEKYVK